MFFFLVWKIVPVSVANQNLENIFGMFVGIFIDFWSFWGYEKVFEGDFLLLEVKLPENLNEGTENKILFLFVWGILHFNAFLSLNITNVVLKKAKLWNWSHQHLQKAFSIRNKSSKTLNVFMASRKKNFFVCFWTPFTFNRTKIF